MQSWTIGSDPECDLVVDKPTVSRRHCRLSRSGNGYLLEDLGSSNGTFVNGEPIHTSRSVTRADTITLGLTALMPWPVEEAWAEPAAVTIGPELGVTTPELTFDKPSMLIGRNPDCDLVIDRPMVSGRHARLARQGEAVLIEDLGSSNGTFVNGQRIDRNTRLTDGDLIGLGSHMLTLRLLPLSDAATPAPLPNSTRPANKLETPRNGQRNGDLIEAQRPTIPIAHIIQFQAPMIAMALIVAFRHDRGSLLFAICLAAIWFGMSSMVSASALPVTWWSEIWVPGGAQSLIIRLGRVIANCAIQCLIAGALIGFGAGLECPAIPLLGIILLASAVGLAIGLVIISMDAQMQTRWAIVGTTFLLLYLLGGGPQTRTWLPSWTGPLTNAAPTRWAFEGLLLLEANQTAQSSGSDGSSMAPIVRQAEVLFPATTERMGLRADVLALFLMSFGFLGLAAFISAERRRC
jgi:pSer/pThr/pTyr-binding forkhead associated (FHA) protein